MNKTSKRFPGIFVCALCAVAFFCPSIFISPAHGTDPNSAINHALIIGIDRYANWPNLVGPAADADSLARLLVQSYNFEQKNITLLTDDSPNAPTRQRILQTLGSYARRLGPKDNLLVVFMGHGFVDENNRTYWIPSDGRRADPATWLGHNELAKDFFASPSLNAHQILVITDAPFAADLLKPKPSLLTGWDLRYKERVGSLAGRPGRTVIARKTESGTADHSPEQDFRLVKRLKEVLEANPLALADVETLLMSPVPGVPALPKQSPFVAGRLDIPLDQGGLFSLEQTEKPPTPNVMEISFIPRTPLPGQSVFVTARTDIAAHRVEFFVSGKAHPMAGSNLIWSMDLKAPSSGPAPYTATAYNIYAQPGQPKTGAFLIEKIPAPLVEVKTADWTPATGNTENQFTLEVTTDSDAESVLLSIFDRQVQMEGSKARWKTQISPETPGEHAFRVAAINADGVQGQAYSGALVVEAPLVIISSVNVNPKSGLDGSTFTVAASTDRPAQSVNLLVGNNSYPMQGEGQSWQLQRPFSGTGQLSLRVVAANEHGKSGPASQATIQLQPIPTRPDVSSVAVAPSSIQTREFFTITANLAAPAKNVSINIMGETASMQGGPKRFTHRTRTDTAGVFEYTITAVTEAGETGTPYSGAISVTKRPLVTVVLERVTVAPDPVNVDQPVQFVAYTGGRAQSVILQVNGEELYLNTDSATLWTIQKPFSEYGVRPYTVWAISEDGIKSNEIAGVVMVRAPIVEIVNSYLEPHEGIRPGQEIIITAITTRPATTVEVSIGSKRHTMQGKDRNWTFKTKAPEDIHQNYSIEIRAGNEEGRYGPPVVWNVTY